MLRMLKPDPMPAADPPQCMIVCPLANRPTDQRIN